MLRVAFVKVVGGGCGAQSTKDPAKKKAHTLIKRGISRDRMAKGRRGRTCFSNMGVKFPFWDGQIS